MGFLTSGCASSLGGSGERLQAVKPTNCPSPHKGRAGAAGVNSAKTRRLRCRLRPPGGPGAPALHRHATARGRAQALPGPAATRARPPARRGWIPRLGASRGTAGHPAGWVESRAGPRRQRVHPGPGTTCSRGGLMRAPAPATTALHTNAFANTRAMCSSPGSLLRVRGGSFGAGSSASPLTGCAPPERRTVFSQRALAGAQPCA